MTAARLRAMGSSSQSIARHYDLPAEFFRLWLGCDLVYSCALWDDHDPADTLTAAQRRKIDFFATELAVGGRRALDIGCGWGALAERFVREHCAASVSGVTLSASQARHATGLRAPGAEFAVQSWVDHEPGEPYDVITAVEFTEHLASDRASEDEKVEVYRSFFDRLAGWLTPAGMVGLQLICLDGVGHAGSRAGRGPLSDLIRTEIFPDAMSASLSEMVLGWETQFELVRFLDHSSHYQRTFRAWAIRYRAEHSLAARLVGDDLARTFARYLAAGEVLFRMREQALYRVILRKRPEPKRWAVRLRPSMLAQALDAEEGASKKAVQYHYDVSNEFYGLWLGPEMMYSAGRWSPGDPPDLDTAQQRKIDFFAGRVVSGPRVLDIGCGWGGTLRRLVAEYEVERAVGLTLSDAQREYALARDRARIEVRLEDWADHVPEAPYDAVVSFGAFEHFASDGSTGPQRVRRYREVFSRCHGWLRPGGRLGLETIAHDGAPDTNRRLGRGPLGDTVLQLFPESLCPHLSELVLGFEPWFEVELLESDAPGFARTFRTWQVRLRANEAVAARLVGADTARRFRRYLAASEVQFRTHALTNYRIVLRRRDGVRR